MKNFRIQRVPHPHKDKGGKNYWAICWDHNGGSSIVNVEFAEETLLLYSTNELDNLELVTAIQMVRDFKGKRGHRSNQGVFTA